MVMKKVTVKKDDKTKKDEQVAVVEIFDDPRLPDKSLFRVDEAAGYFDVSERTVRLWIEHRILDSVKVGGIVRIPREAILKCRMKKREE